MSAIFAVMPRHERQLAVRVWPGNEEALSALCSSGRMEAEGDETLLFQRRDDGSWLQVGSKGDWAVLFEGYDGSYLFRAMTDEVFRAEYVITESAHELGFKEEK